MLTNNIQAQLQVSINTTEEGCAVTAGGGFLGMCRTPDGQAAADHIPQPTQRA